MVTEECGGGVDEIFVVSEDIDGMTKKEGSKLVDSFINT